MKKVIDLVKKGFLVIFGINIEKFNMEFGYIESFNGLDVKCFIEKLSLEKVIEF